MRKSWLAAIVFSSFTIPSCNMADHRSGHYPISVFANDVGDTIALDPKEIHIRFVNANHPYWSELRTYSFRYRVSDDCRIHFIMPSAWVGVFPALEFSDNRNAVKAVNPSATTVVYRRLAPNGEHPGE
jgi:hypothetical protein